MLAGKRLFLGETDYATVKLIQKANVPRLVAAQPRGRRGVRGESCSGRSTRDPEHRYQSAREFGDALSDYLFRSQLMVTAYDIANLVQAVDLGRARTPTADEFSLIDRLIQEELDESVAYRRESGSLPSGRPAWATRRSSSARARASRIRRAGSATTRTCSARRAADGGSRRRLSQSGSWREGGIPATPPARREQQAPPPRPARPKRAAPPSAQSRSMTPDRRIRAPARQ